MATFLRLAARQGCRLSSLSRALKPQTIHPACFISTSKKNTDSATVNEAVKNVPTTEDKPERLVEKDENWMSYGYDIYDRASDEHYHFMYMFLGITLCCVGGAFVFAYQPDHRLRDWSQREAYLLLAERERDGLPLIDGNLVPVDQFELPSDEELGDFEVIV